MKDILGRELKIGDIVAHGTRSGNGGDLNVKIIAEIRHKTETRWGHERELEQCKVINYSYVTRVWDKESRQYVDCEPHYEKGGTGWSEGYCMLIVNESVPNDLKDFLRGLV